MSFNTVSGTEEGNIRGCMRGILKQLFDSACSSVLVPLQPHRSGFHCYQQLHQSLALLVSIFASLCFVSLSLSQLLN